MKNREARIFDTLSRVESFGTNRPAEFRADSGGGQVLTELTALIEELTHQAQVQVTSAISARAGSLARASARERLREVMRAINRTVLAIAIATDNPLLKAKFRLSRPGDQRLLNGARAFVPAIEPLTAEFAKHDLPDILVRLRKAIEDFEAAVDEQNRSTLTRITATKSLEKLLAHGLRLVRRLDAIVRNKFADDKATLAAWESASHLERRHGRSKDGRLALPEEGSVGE